MGNGASKKRHGVLFISHDNKVTFFSFIVSAMSTISKISIIYVYFV